MDYGPLLLPVHPLANWTVSQAVASLYILLHTMFPPNHVSHALRKNAVEVFDRPTLGLPRFALGIS